MNATATDPANGEAIALELLAVEIYVRTLEGNKMMLRKVPIPDGKGKKVLEFIKHRIHGGQLRLSKEALEIPQERPAEEKPPLIVPP